MPCVRIKASAFQVWVGLLLAERGEGRLLGNKDKEETSGGSERRAGRLVE